MPSEARRVVCLVPTANATDGTQTKDAANGQRTPHHATTMHKRKRVDAASAVLGALSRAQRQLVAVTFGEATARRAKSVQCKLDRKGRLCTSVYLDWPPHSREPNPDEPDWHGGSGCAAEVSAHQPADGPSAEGATQKDDEPMTD